jgi:hypothetical protein
LIQHHQFFVCPDPSDSIVILLARRWFNLLGLVNPGEKIPRRNLVKRLLDLIKGTNLFTQE